MNNEPFEIPPDILEKYGEPGEKAEFDRVLGNAVKIAPEQMPPLKDEPKKPKGRPRKTE